MNESNVCHHLLPGDTYQMVAQGGGAHTKNRRLNTWRRLGFAAAEALAMYRSYMERKELILC